MHAAIHSTTRRLTYQAHERDTLLSEVAQTVCLLLPRACLVAGFHEQGDILAIHYTTYSDKAPAWSEHFLKQVIEDDPLLGLMEPVKGVFVASCKGLIIPEPLFEPQAAAEWLRRIFYIEPDETIRQHLMGALDARYVYALPADAQMLAGDYFSGIPLLPLASCQQSGAHKPVLLHCCLTEDMVMASLQREGRLIWHQSFEYQTTEDIAYQLAALCRQEQLRVIDLHIQATAVCPELHHTLTELQAYFPKLKTGPQTETGNDWTPVMALARQMLGCVS